MHDTTSDNRTGYYVMTFTGGRWWPHSPRPEDVRVKDLDALAQVNRFGGATSYQWPEWRKWRLAPYPVAQHSCYVYDLVTEWIANGKIDTDLVDFVEEWIADGLIDPDLFDIDPILVRRCAALHDGHEIYPPGDQLSPTLRYDCEISSALKSMSRKAADAFRTAMKIPLVMPGLVKLADVVMVATEKRDLMHPELEIWGENGRKLPKPKERRIEVWDPEHARNAFFRRLEEIAPDLFAAS